MNRSEANQIYAGTLKRNQRIIELLERGYTQADIARLLDMKRQRVNQIIKAYYMRQTNEQRQV